MLKAAMFVIGCISTTLFVMRMAIRFESWCERRQREAARKASMPAVPKAHLIKLGAFMPRRSKCHHEPMLWWIDGRLQPVCRVCFELHPKLGGEMP